MLNIDAVRRIKNIPDSRASSSLNLLLIFLLLAYFSMAPQFLFAIRGLAGWSGFRDALLYSIPWLLVPLYFPRVTKPWLIVAGSIIGLISCIKLGYYLIYQQEISQSVFLSSMETNPQEMMEFFELYYRWDIPLWLVLFILPALILYRAIAIPAPTKNQHRWIAGLSITLLCSPFLWYSDNSDKAMNRFLKRHAVVEPWGMLQNYIDYRHSFSQAEKFLARMQSADHAATPVKLRDTEKNQTYVLVIGESTNRQRMGLYGYSRDTSPELVKMRNQLLVYPDVVSSIAYTIESLSTALTFAGLSDYKNAFEHMNIVTMMQRAGFKVQWITNQQSLSQRNTLLTAFANLADEAVFLNNNRRQSSRQPDDAVLEPFNKALQDPAEKKLIIVHLLGTHFKYQYRYPESFSTFDGEKPPSALAATDNDIETYNAYDNAIRYNDFIIAELISRYWKSDPYGALLYFSDHGEEVFDVQRFNGRNAGVPSTNMYTVPFVIWPSPRWQQHRDMAQLNASVNRPYSLSWFMHGWCDLVQIDYAKCNAGRSVFSADFKSATRWLGASVNGKPSSYDQLAKNEMAKNESGTNQNRKVNNTVVDNKLLAKLKQRLGKINL
jgi:heptose-I-phosphate ethanolaminephosphotransferase